MSKLLLLVFLFLGFHSFSFGQDYKIKIKNPSFEGRHHTGNDYNKIDSWFNAGRRDFPAQSPPDLHLDSVYHKSDSDCHFGVKQSASDGNTFLGLVARSNETYETIAQDLILPLGSGNVMNLI